MLSDVDKRLKVICSLVMLAAIALMPLTGMSDLQAQEDDTFHLGPPNPDFVKFWEEPLEPFYGYIPPPMDLSHLDAIPMGGLLKSGALPPSFDWRDQGKVTSIKNQNPCGTCWIFGTTSVLESAVLVGEDTEYDFSEQSVALCVDRSWVYLYDHADEPCGLSHGGGWSSLAIEVFIKKGAVLESCNPYNTSGLQCNGACLCDNCTPVKKVNGYRYVTDDQSQIDWIKEVVYNQGPVTAAYYHDGAHQYTDYTYGTVYDCATCPIANHMVSIIGWDDSVPHFETPGTGAWLVKNSWGIYSGNNGYLWLAYNSSCTEDIAYLKYKGYDSNEKLYYWDEAGMVDDGGYEDHSAWMANIFISTQDGSLTHVDFWTTSNNAEYDIYVYLDGNILDGLDNLDTLQSGTCQEFGYYSIPLTSPVPLTSGQPFTIAVNMTTPGYNEPIPVEKVIGGFVEPPIQGEVSYAKHGDTDAWDDLASQGFNACLRARVTSIAAEQPDITVTPPSFNVTLPTDTVQNYNLTIGNDGDATLNYNISDRETTGEGSTAGVESPTLNPASALSTGAQVVLNPTSDVQKALSNRVLTEVMKSERTASGLESVSFYSEDAYWEDKIPSLVITTGLPTDCPWLDENIKSGSVPAGGSNNITVTIDTAGLTAGNTYTAEIVIDNNDLDENPTTVPVTLHISGVALSIVPPNYTAVVNEIFTVDIELSGPDPVRAAEAHIDFDNTYLEVQGITAGTALETVLENAYNNTAGTIDYSAGKLSGTLPTGTFTLATIELKALAETSSTTTLTFVFEEPDRVTDVITSPVASVLGTVTNGEITITSPTVNGKVAFQGRPDPPDPSWVNPLTVVVYEQGTSNVVGTYAVTTNSTGAFSFAFQHALGTYDIGVKGSHTLSRLEEDVVIDSGTNNVDFGTLLEGDCYENDVINTWDFGILADAFGSVANGPPWDERADLNNDGRVNIYDFGLLADNYGLSGEMPS